MFIVAIVTLLASFFLLAIICEEYFVVSLDKIAARLKMPSDVAGATLMAVGSSAPELFTSLFAMLKPGAFANIGAGTIVGSAIFNILVIIGASAMYKRATLTWQPVVRDLIFYILTICALIYVFYDGKIVLFEAILFLVMYVIYIIAVMKWKKLLPYNDVDPLDIVQEATQRNKFMRLSHALLAYVIPKPDSKNNRYVLTFFVSIAYIAALSYALVESSVIIGEVLHINSTIIALTVLAAGTSIPDLLSSIIVAKQGRGDMAVSNAVGSNIFDILFALGFPWLIVFMMGTKEISVSTENLMSSVFLLFATVLAIIFILVVRKWTIGKRAGLLLIGLYIAYIAYIVRLVLG